MSSTRINITISGSTPLLCNRFTEAQQIAASEGTRGSSLNGDKGTPREICEDKLYRSTDGALVIPQPNLLRCLAEGGRYHKIGKSQVTTAKSSLMFACFDIIGTDIPIIHKDPWQVDTRPIRNPSTGGRLLCHRPLFNDWSLAFEGVLDTQIMSPKLLRQVIDDAGKRVGLGDFRPQTKGPFGRFVVTQWAEQK